MPKDGSLEYDLSVELDSIVGCWFWWDNPSMRGVYHGVITGSLDGGYYLLRFDDSDDLPSGVHEVINIERIAAECWSLFESEGDLRKALSAND